MRSKFKDEHPFGELTHIFFPLCTPYTFAREAQSWGRANPAEVPRSDSCQCLSSYIITVHSFLIHAVAQHQQVICEKADRTDIPTIDKKKYLVPSVCSWNTLPLIHLLFIFDYPGPYCWPICLCYPKTNQTSAWESHLHIRRWGSSTHSCIDECYLRGAQVRITHWMSFDVTPDVILHIGMRTTSCMWVTLVKTHLDKKVSWSCH